MAAPLKFWTAPLETVASYLPSMPSLPIHSPTVDFAAKITEWCTIIGEQMNLIRQGIG